MSRNQSQVAISVSPKDWMRLIHKFLEHLIEHDPPSSSNLYITERQKLPATFKEGAVAHFCYVFKGRFLPSGKSDGKVWKPSQGPKSMGDGTVKRYFYYKSEGMKIKRQVIWLAHNDNWCFLDYRLNWKGKIKINNIQTPHKFDLNKLISITSPLKLVEVSEEDYSEAKGSSNSEAESVESPAGSDDHSLSSSSDLPELEEPQSDLLEGIYTEEIASLCAQLGTASHQQHHHHYHTSPVVGDLQPELPSDNFDADQLLDLNFSSCSSSPDSPSQDDEKYGVNAYVPGENLEMDPLSASILEFDSNTMLASAEFAQKRKIDAVPTSRALTSIDDIQSINLSSEIFTFSSDNLTKKRKISSSTNSSTDDLLLWSQKFISVS